MKMTKRGLAVLLALCMIFSFAGCAIAEDVASEQTEVLNATEEQTEVAATADEDEEAPAAEEEAAAEEEEEEEEAAEEEAAEEEAEEEEEEAAAEEEEEEAEEEATEEEAAAEEEEAEAEEEEEEEAAEEEADEDGEAADEEDLVVIEDEQTPLGVGGNTASALPGAESGVPAQASPFTANVRVKMVSGSEIYFGDTVTLAAVVDGASAEYTIRWEYSDGGAWTPCGTGETYSFVVNETNALYTFRAVAVEKVADAA